MSWRLYYSVNVAASFSWITLILGGEANAAPQERPVRDVSLKGLVRLECGVIGLYLIPSDDFQSH